MTDRPLQFLFRVADNCSKRSCGILKRVLGKGGSETLKLCEFDTGSTIHILLTYNKFLLFYILP